MAKKDDHAREKARHEVREPGLEEFGLQAALLALALASLQGEARDDAAEAPPAAADCPSPPSSQVAGGQPGAQVPGAGPVGLEAPFWPGAIGPAPGPFTDPGAEGGQAGAPAETGTAPAVVSRRSTWRHHWVAG